jgi:hypothetical protein
VTHRIPVAVVAVILGLASCSSASHSEGRVTGTLRIVGGVGVDRAIPGTVTLADASGRRVVVPTSATGSFGVSVRTGRYNVTLTSPQINDGRSECSVPTPTVVVRNEIAEVRVVCPIE